MNRSATLSSIVAVLTIAAVSLVGLAPAATAAETRTISGVVTLPGGPDAAAQDELTVRVAPAGTNAYLSVDVTSTGAFSISGLAPGAYHVCASTSQYRDGSGNFVYPDNVLNGCINTADYWGARGTVDATASNLTGLTLALPWGKTISGTVTLGAGAEPSWLQGVRVSAYRYVGGGYAGAETKPNPLTGAYTIKGLYPGEYPVNFQGREFVDNATGNTVIPLLTEQSWTDETGNVGLVNVGSTSKTGIDVTVEPSGASGIFTIVPTPIIQGAPVVGSTLTALPGNWAPTATGFTYQWRRDGSAIPGATSATYALSSADLDKPITVAVTASAPGIASRSVVSKWLYPQSTFTTVGTPTLTGTGLIGSTLTCHLGSWVPTPDSVGIYWLRGTSTIPGASGTSYSITAEDSGSLVRCGVQATRDFTSVQQQSNPVSVPQVFASAGTVTIVGARERGATLTAALSGTNPEPDSVSYQWYRGGAAIAGATASTYVLTQADSSAVIRVSAQVQRTGYLTTATTAAQLSLPGFFATAPNPSISGNVALGSTLTAIPGTWSPVANLAYQWLRNGELITGATSPTYQLTAADGGSSFSVRATGTKAGYVTQVRTSDLFVVPLYFTTTPTPSVTGTARVGSALTVATGSWDPSPSQVTYQWLRGGNPIAGATSSEYTLTSADGGMSVSARVTASLDGYAPQTIESSPVKVTGVFTTAPVPTISGTLRAGYTLTAIRGTWSPTATYSYQWYRSGAKITNATNKTYKLTTADRGKKITVRVTGKRTGFETLAKTSASKTIAYEFSKAVTPTITGTLKAGSTLTAIRGTWSPTPTYSYQWYRSGAKITKATHKTYKLTTADRGKKITVKVTGRKTGYTTVTKTSSAKTISR